MTEATLETLGARLSRLEQEKRRLKRLGLGLLIGVVAVGLVAIISIVRTGAGRPDAGPKLVEAEKLVLRDASGKIRAEFGLAADGSPRLDFFDQDEKRRVGLFLLPDGARLYFADKTGTLQAALAVPEGTGAALQLVDRGGTVHWRAP